MSNGIAIFKFAEILKKAVVFGNSSGRRARVLGDTKTMGTQTETGVPITFRRSSVVSLRQDVGGTPDPVLWTKNCSAE
jgi:hypothetical protein